MLFTSKTMRDSKSEFGQILDPMCTEDYSRISETLRLFRISAAILNFGGNVTFLKNCNT